MQDIRRWSNIRIVINAMMAMEGVEEEALEMVWVQVCGKAESVRWLLNLTRCVSLCICATLFLFSSLD